MRKVQSNVILVQSNEGNTKCNKSIVTCDVGTTQYDNRTIKCEKINEGNTEYDKSTVTCDVGTTQCDNRTVKCGKKNLSTTKCEKGTVKCDVGITFMIIELSNVRKNK